jgi:riboflavin kinase / FMN adenylyltransferase
MNEKTFRGIVVHGDGYGRKLGYPTANIEITEPLSGVFAGTVEYDRKTHLVAIFASERRQILEAHLLDFDGDIYGKEIVVHIQKHLRDARTFSDETELRTAIAADIVSIRAWCDRR